MNNESIAPCGVICDLCLGFQRDKNTCVGCTNNGNKPYHCRVCSIKLCAEKNGNEKLLCDDCVKYPCRRIKNLDKRYTTQYGESPIQNFKTIKEIGLDAFINHEKEKWKCASCGYLLCVHREVCLNCGYKNEYYPQRIK
jgi:hypothetical protein